MLPKLRFVWPLTLAVTAIACTDTRIWKAGHLERVSVELERPETVEPEEEWGFIPQAPNTLTYTVGDVFCTPPSKEVTVPFKLLVIMDFSGSMGNANGGNPASDPNRLRLDAVEELVNRYSTDPSVYFGFLPFSAQNRPLNTLGMDFSNDPGTLQAAIDEMRGLPDIDATNYQDALRWAWDAITSDIDKDNNVPGTRYGILFFTDGRPNRPENTGSPDGDLDANRPKIYGLITGCGDNAVHPDRPLEGLVEFINTYFLYSNFDQPAADLLQDMASGPGMGVCDPNSWGHGEYTEIDQNNLGNFRFDIALPTYRQVLVSRGGVLFQNHSMRAVYQNGRMVMARDSDADGLSDFEESANPVTVEQSSMFLADTDGDGISDLVARRRGLPPNAPQPPPEIYPRPPADPSLVPHGMLFGLGPYLASDADDDGDGLTNYEERFLGTDPNNEDTDSDTLSDYVELRFELNPLLATDAALDLDSDGRDSKTEVELGLSPRKAESEEFVERYAFRISYGDEFTIEEPNPNGGRDIARTCYEFRIDNINYQSTLREDGTLNEFNLFELSFVDQPPVPLDDSERVYRRTVVKADPQVDGPSFYFRRQLPNSW